MTADMQQVDVFDGAIAVIVLGMHADDGGLDAQVDVFGHQRDAHRGHFDLQCQRLRQNRVVGFVTRQAFRQCAGECASLKKQPTGGHRLAVTGHGRLNDDAFVDVGLGGTTHQVIEEA